MDGIDPTTSGTVVKQYDKSDMKLMKSVCDLPRLRSRWNPVLSWHFPQLPRVGKRIGRRLSARNLKKRIFYSRDLLALAGNLQQ